MDPASLLTVAVSLFFILDPFASLPVFMSVTKGLDGDTVRSYADRAALVAAVLLVVFIFAGPYLMDVFGITMDSFRVAGGIMLLLMPVGWSEPDPGGKMGAWLMGTPGFFLLLWYSGEELPVRVHT